LSPLSTEISHLLVEPRRTIALGTDSASTNEHDVGDGPQELKDSAVCGTAELTRSPVQRDRTVQRRDHIAADERPVAVALDRRRISGHLIDDGCWLRKQTPH
jgi:hypothetical protein